MSNYDFSYEASLSDEKFFQGGVQRTLPKREEIESPWVDMIVDLVLGAGYSYSRIAYRVGASPSAIQKLVTQPNRRPRFKIFEPLLKLHCKVFYGQYATPKAKEYLRQKRRFD